MRGGEQGGTSFAQRTHQLRMERKSPDIEV